MPIKYKRIDRILVLLSKNLIGMKVLEITGRVDVRRRWQSSKLKMPRLTAI